MTKKFTMCAQAVMTITLPEDLIYTNCVKKNNCHLCRLDKLALSGADRGH